MPRNANWPSAPAERCQWHHLIEPDAAGRVPLVAAAARGDVERVHVLLALGLAPDAMGPDGTTALVAACCEAPGGDGRLADIVRLLLDARANVHAREPQYGFSPLKGAIARRDRAVIRMLLKRLIRPDEA